ncbi:hypothetical protein [Paractinoplanes toevensis]|uniref:Uncharacterized protein n=1 Tax=Paractinoplanes toevensis TaxID=571911 RepID=A0A919WDA2_9ACTN|nr:hypothetical protein [Actinoplanes toevensis]GIM98046.1 hypothetical protein Ato02nite_098390 [Actinoplanes toevensis]
MPVRFTAAPSASYRVRRPLSTAELDTVRQHLHADVPDPQELLNTVVAAVFTALLTDVGETYPDHEPDPRFERGLYAIPISQWTAICLALTSRAATWGPTTTVEMDFAALMPSAYDDPTATTPDLGPPEQPASSIHIEVTREAADTIAACGRHIAALAYAYGGLDLSFIAAADTWSEQLTRLLSAPAGTRVVLHADGPLSLLVSTGNGDQSRITFRPSPTRCIAAGRCQAVATTTGGVVLWQPDQPGAVVLDHEHEPDAALDRPRPGTWITQP